jgi:hypothetical protein
VTGAEPLEPETETVVAFCCQVLLGR